SCSRNSGADSPPRSVAWPTSARPGTNGPPSPRRWAGPRTAAASNWPDCSIASPGTWTRKDPVMREPTQSFDLMQRYWSLREQGSRPDLRTFLGRAGDLPPDALLAVLRVDQLERWARGERVSAANYLREFPALGSDVELAVELIYGEFLIRAELDESPA